MTAPKLHLYESQQLRFVNKTQQTIDIAAGKYDFSKMMFADYFVFSDVKDLNYVGYCSLIEQGDTTFIQFPTTYTDFNLTLVKVSPYTETSYNGVETLVTTYTDIAGDSVNVYNVVLPTSSLSGEYYFKIVGNTPSFPVVEWWSEPFEIAADHEETVVLKWGGNSTKNDGLTWSNVAYEIDTYQQIRIEAKILSPKYSIGQNTYDDSDTELTTLRVYPTATHVLYIKKIPWYIYEKICLAIGHDEFKINDVLYNTAEDFELTDFTSQLYFSGTIPLRLVEYQNNTVMPTLTGDAPVFADSNLLINGTDSLLINGTDKLKINN